MISKLNYTYLKKTMYPDLSYILHALLGTSPDNWTSIVKTFGLMLVIAILTAAFMLSKELKRKEAEGLLKGIKEKRTVAVISWLGLDVNGPNQHCRCG